METNKKVIEVLNDLIRINNDRIEGYETALKDTENIDMDLRSLFNGMMNESREYVNELTAEVRNLGGEPSTDSTFAGKIYRAWMNVKNTFTGKDRKAILESCEYGEDAAQKAYEEALAEDITYALGVRQMISNQKANLRKSHDLIKSYRDAHVESH